MRFLTSILLTSLLLAVSAVSGHSNSSLLQPTSLASLQTLSATPQLIVKRGQPRHRGSGRVESSLGVMRSLA